MDFSFFSVLFLFLIVMHYARDCSCVHVDGYKHSLTLWHVCIKSLWNSIHIGTKALCCIGYMRRLFKQNGQHTKSCMCHWPLFSNHDLHSSHTSACIADVGVLPV